MRRFDRRLDRLEAASIPKGLPPAARRASPALLATWASLPPARRAQLTNDDVRDAERWYQRSQELCAVAPVTPDGLIDLEPIIRQLATEIGDVIGVSAEDIIREAESIVAEMAG